jgi:hypothetical protein
MRSGWVCGARKYRKELANGGWIAGLYPLRPCLARAKYYSG